jgi:YggT family protein
MSVALLLQEFAYSVAGLLAGVVNYAYYILFPSYPSSGFFQAIYDAVRAVTNPILWPIRSRIPMLRLGGFGIDLSPIIAILGLSIARRLLLIVIEEFIGPVTG